MRLWVGERPTPHLHLLFSPISWAPGHSPLGWVARQTPHSLEHLWQTPVANASSPEPWHPGASPSPPASNTTLHLKSSSGSATELWGRSNSIYQVAT